MSDTNAANLQHAFDYLDRVITARIELHQRQADDPAPEKLPGLAFFEDSSAFAGFIRERQPSFDEYVVLLLALVPHVQPSFLDNLFLRRLPDQGLFAEFGGSRDNANRLFQPTGETALFTLAGIDLDRRFEVQKLFSADHWFAAEGVLQLQTAKPGEPGFSGRLLLNPDYVELFTTGSISAPHFSSAFPAQRIGTGLAWEDLVLDSNVQQRIDEIRCWIEHHRQLMQDWQMAARFKPGYRVLFHGPPGTGKTLTATLLGKHTGREVYRVDLSTVVSKYIGETEKNLAALFDKARNRDWILFFDEADALFGKRTGIKDAHDRFANQEVSYLLQKVEEFDGLVILASNLKSNLDDAFLRRFNAVIGFPLPAAREREQIWRISMPTGVSFDTPELPYERLARFELSGGTIINAVHYACLQALSRGGDKHLVYDDLQRGIALEMEKEGRVFKPL
ncbi:ATP-binding protein [Marinobacterium sp. YM272]|uniref:ATP-binding protein n=1 Tax=Marinobacterium sp. YM272 TaxID=3421654 RepID=UPI003D7F45B3